jgi:subtilisin family serine protease
VAAKVAAKVTPAVRQKIASEGKSTFWVVLNKQADLRTAHTKKIKAAKAAEVYKAKTEFARTSQAGLRTLLDSVKADYTTFWISNTIKVTGDAKLLGEIAARSDVARIHEDKPLPLPKPFATGLKRLAEVNSVEWNIDRIKAPQVWAEGVRGEGMVVASVDSGVAFEHPALAKNYRGKKADGSFNHDYAWFDPSRTCPTTAPCDTNGHGTHTMGTMVGDDGTNQIGVAPGATWVAARGCETSSCSEASLLAAGQWIVAPTNAAGTDPRPDLAPDVVNNSWGSNAQDPWYKDIVTAWVAAGVFPSFANGNAGPGCSTTGSPGSYTNSYSSGATDINNNIASFSSRGLGENSEIKPNIAAPGANVRSSIPGGGYESFSGTSMAAPHTTATVALMWSASPAIVGNIAETRALLDSTAIDVNDTSCGGTAGDNLVYGEGRLDAYAAVAATPRGDTGALGGTVTSGEAPLAGATVTADGPIDRTATTSADGKYNFPKLSTGEYALKATKFGYTIATGTGTVTANGTTTVDLSVTAAASATLSGTVTSAGAPAADALVELVGTPLSTRTNAEGRYSIVAPQGEYNVKVTFASRCADSATKTVALTADTTLDITLPERVDSYGYACGAASGTYPTLTSKLDLTGDDAVKAVDLPFAVPFYGSTYTAATITTNATVALGTASSTGANTTIPAVGTPNGTLYPFWDDLRVDGEAAIYTGVVGTAPHRSFAVEWRNVSHYSDVNQRLSVMALIGEDGSVVYRYKDVAGTGLEAGSSATIGLENAAGTVAFQYSYNAPVLKDGFALSFRTTKSGVMRGTVLDSNDSKGVAGAKVTVKSGDAVVGTATTGADGGYLAQVGAGDLSVTIEAANYEPKTSAVALAAGGVASVDVALRTGRVAAGRDSVEVVVPAGESRNRTIELTNTGGLDAQYSVSEAAGGTPSDVPWLTTIGGPGTLKPGEASTVLVTVSTAGLAPGTHHSAEVRITSTSGRTPVLTVPVRLVVPGFQAAIDAGSQHNHVDALGDTWQPDKPFAAGSCGYLGTAGVVSTKKPIAGTTDQIRFADARQNMYEYRCDGVANGVYTVELDFAELKDTKPNKRVFDVLIEGAEVLPSLDIALEVGSFHATNRTYTVKVVDGQLNVRFVTHTGFGKPLVNALRLTQRPDKTG